MDYIYGVHSVLECLKSNPKVLERLYLAEGATGRNIKRLISLAKEKGISFKFEPRAALDHRAGGGVHQGVVASCAARAYLDLEDLLSGFTTRPLVAVLDSIEDPRNLGAVLRSCAAGGVEGVILPKDHAAGLTFVASKTAEGGLEHLRIARVVNLVRAIEDLKQKGLWIVGLETGQPQWCYEIDCSGPLAFVVGNEGAGLRRLVREHCDFLVSVPTPGPIRSLNVSVVAGIFIYECLRQRMTLDQRRNEVLR